MSCVEAPCDFIESPASLGSRPLAGVSALEGEDTGSADWTAGTGSLAGFTSDCMGCVAGPSVVVTGFSDGVTGGIPVSFPPTTSTVDGEGCSTGCDSRGDTLVAGWDSNDSSGILTPAEDLAATMG